MSERSLERITKTDLKKLARLASAEREDFFERHPEWALLYRKRLICSALCEDSALHFFNGTTGVRDFQVWSFYAAHADAPFPYKQVSRRDFGKSKFGADPDNPRAYVGRRVELHGRSLECLTWENPIETLQQYLRSGETPTARELREKAVVLIEPERLVGYVAWPSLAVAMI